MMKSIVPLLLLLLAASTGLASPNAVTCEVTTAYYDSSTAALTPLAVDTHTFYLGIPRAGFPVAFAVEAEVTAIDTHRVDLTIHVTTAGALPHLVSKRFSVEYGLPAEIRGINAREGQDYRLRFVPLASTDETPEPCTFTHTTPGQFRIFPAASMNINYVPGSLAEFHQTLIRDVMQTRFKQFQAAFGLSLPGRYDVYACPCALPNVLWDKRFAIAADPTRSLVFVLHEPDFTSVDPFAVCHTAVLRQFGYSPPFLSEGLAGYFSLSIPDMRQLIADELHVPLSRIIPTADYLTADPVVADRTAATCVRFLIDAYGWERFRTLYEQAHDGNLLDRVSATYDMTLDQIQQQWLQWIDTVTIAIDQVHLAAEQAEVLRQYGPMSKHYHLMLSLATSKRDSSLAQAGLVNAAYSIGDYYEAINMQQARVINADSSVATLNPLAGYQLMAGDYEQADQTISRVLATDPENFFAHFSRGLLHLAVGDSAAARQTFRELALSDQADPSPEVSILLAALSTPDDETSTPPVEVRNLLERRIALNPAEASAYLWLAWLGIVEARHGAAAGPSLQVSREALEAAHLIENRAFYLGMLYLLEGKLADMRQDRRAARDWYGRVLSNASAAYHQQEAAMLFNTPYGSGP